MTRPGRKTLSLVGNYQDAMKQIERYAVEALASKELRSRISRTHAWYAVPQADGGWSFAPSKFTGYIFVSADEYLQHSRNHGPANGRVTEKVLQQWFEPVDEHSTLGKRLREELRRFARDLGEDLRQHDRINVPRKTLTEAPPLLLKSGSDRILHDPAICGGAATIRGTRMRVADIVAMLADGAEISDILADFDYLTKADIYAALAYASEASSHRVVQAA